MIKSTELKPENFLILERSLSDRLKKRWVKQFAPIKKKLLEAERNDDPIAAHDIVESLDQLSELHRGMHQYIEYVGTAAVLFGASRIRPLEETTFMTGPKQVPEVVKNATLVFGHLLTESRKTIKKVAHQMLVEIEKQRLLSDESQLFKADAIRDEQFYLDRIQEAGEGTIDIVASLHTSRLSSYGFLIEADATGATEYQIDEVLDSRTCSLCNYMHGKTFKVERALNRVEQVVEIDDPEELKVVAPFFKQTKDNLAKLRNMTVEQLAMMGMDTPPFHPICRGLLAVSGTVVELEQVEDLPRPPVEFTLEDFNIRNTDTPEEYIRVLETLPEESKQIIEKFEKPKFIIEVEEGKGWYSVAEKTIDAHLAEEGIVFKHEYGHHIDRVTALEGNTWWSSSVEFKRAMEEDRRLWGIHPDLRSDSPILLRLANHVYAPVIESVPYGSMVGRFDMGRTMMLGDIIDALSKGTYRTHWNLAGHGKTYFRTNESALIEIFANMFSLYGDEVAWQVVRTVAPSMSKVFEERILELVDMELDI